MTVTRRDKANAIRALSMDAVQRANSGHPGAPMGLADIAEVLWADFLVHDPTQPQWANRDRFVLSNGHASMLIYALLHLSGYALSMDDIKQFRQLHARTPGHPEYGDTPGIETTTGPLGQGLANAVGMALAEKTLGAQFNRAAHSIIDHFTYVFLGDGCLMEGISHECCSLAGTWQLGKLIAFYDDNGISIDGAVAGWFTDDTPQRFASYGWHVIATVDGHDPTQIAAAIHQARAVSDRPSLICCQTVIGFGSPHKAGSEASHGAALGEAEIALVRAQLSWPHPPFVIPDPIYAAWNHTTTGRAAHTEWDARFAAYRQECPDLAAELTRRWARELPAEWAATCRAQVDAVARKKANIATRVASLNAIETLSPVLPELIGGSADLAASNLTLWSAARGVHEHADGNYIYFGVREFAMAAITNGLALYRGLKPFAATFLIFSEYARNALRMAALMKCPSLFIFTHDSIGLGEDGPTHQAVEQLASLRLIPGMSVWRPCDAVETMVAWQQACEATAQPFSLLLSRQTLPHQPRDAAQLAAIARGGYILHDCTAPPQLILIATGSEVALAMAAAHQCPQYRIRVVSMPSLDRFAAQPVDYREAVLPTAIAARLAIEAGVGDNWYRYVGRQGAVISMEQFGHSAPAAELFAHFGFTTEHVVAKVEAMLTDADTDLDTDTAR